MRRCCSAIPGEFEPCYASVLVHGPGEEGLRGAVSDLESKGIITPCFTGWCPRCRGLYMLTSGMAMFGTPSAHHTHQLCLLQQLRRAGLFPSAGGAG